jgi:hypothetical protein
VSHFSSATRYTFQPPFTGVVFSNRRTVTQIRSFFFQTLNSRAASFESDGIFLRVCRLKFAF